MSFEVRRVPPDWEHPKFTGAEGQWLLPMGQYQPMKDEEFHTAAKAWIEGLINSPFGSDEGSSKVWYYWESKGSPPNRHWYRLRKWETTEATAYQIYETTSHGTPVSPVYLTQQEVDDWISERSEIKPAKWGRFDCDSVLEYDHQELFLVVKPISEEKWAEFEELIAESEEEFIAQANEIFTQGEIIALPMATDECNSHVGPNRELNRDRMIEEYRASKGEI